MIRQDMSEYDNQNNIICIVFQSQAKRFKISSMANSLQFFSWSTCICAALPW